MDGQKETPADETPDVISQAIAWVKKRTVWEVCRLIWICSTVWGFVLLYGGDYMTSRADDILESALKRKGMGPGEIKLMQDRLIELGLDVDRLAVTARNVDGKLTGLDTRLQVLDANQRQMYELLRSLIPAMKAELDERQP